MPKIESEADIKAVFAARRGGGSLHTSPRVLTPEYVKQMDSAIARQVQIREGYQAKGYKKAGQVRFGG